MINYFYKMENIDNAIVRKQVEDIDMEIDEMFDIVDPNSTYTTKKKRGRKPKDKKNKYYFSEREQNAVIEYISNTKIIKKATKEMLLKTFGMTEDEYEKEFDGRSLYDILQISENITIEDKNTLYQVSVLKNDIEVARKENDAIYNEILKPAFHKMVESIMRVFHGYIPTEETGQTFGDTVSYLITKIDKYDPNRNTKAYSYYGNACKNYLKGKLLNYSKELLRNPSYDDDGQDFDITNNINYSVKQDKGARTAHEIVEELKNKFSKMVEYPSRYDLKESEVILGKALINLLNNWDYVMSTDGSNKLNKSAVLFFLREQTNMDTKGIRDNMKKFKNEFLLVKNFIIS